MPTGNFEKFAVRRHCGIGYDNIGLLEISREETFTEPELARFTAIAKQLTVIFRHKQVEETLRNSEKRFRRLVENAPDVITRY